MADVLPDCPSDAEVTREMAQAGLWELSSWNAPTLPVCEVSEAAMVAAYIAMDRVRFRPRALGSLRPMPADQHAASEDAA